MNFLQRTALKLTGFSYLVDAANPIERYRRPYEPLSFDSIPKEINLSDWQSLVSDSRKLFSNLGPAKGAIVDKATYAVGRAWAPKFTGKDQSWGEEVEHWLADQWYQTADVRGGMFDFRTDLYMASVCADRDGEIYILLTESAEGWPQIQLIPAHMIGSRYGDEGVLQKGPYRGLRCMQGVVVNDVGRPVAYRVLAEKPEDDAFVSARDLIQVYDPEWPDQVRGLPAFTHALLDLKDLRQIQGNEKIVSAMAASIGILMYNETGAADADDPATRLRRLGVSNDGPTVVEETHAGVRTMFFRAKGGGKAEQMRNERPGAVWENFMNRLIRNACVGAGWPYELTWDSSALGGANVRLLVARAMRTVQDRQDLLLPVARRCVGYAVAKAIKQGILTPNPEWYKWSFRMPQKMSVDYGRDGKSDREDYVIGIKNLADILAEEGTDLDEHIEQRKKENEMLTDAGLPTPHWEGMNWGNANKPADAAAKGDTPSES
jgi:capsid protein